MVNKHKIKCEDCICLSSCIAKYRSEKYMIKYGHYADGIVEDCSLIFNKYYTMLNIDGYNNEIDLWWKKNYGN